MRTFDVLIVYSSSTAYSAGDPAYTGSTPFSTYSETGIYNAAYAYFLEACAHAGVTAAFTTSSDISGAGMCTNYWRYSHKKWTKVRADARALHIFDKFTPIGKHSTDLWKKLFSSPTVRQYNDPSLMRLFNDKLATGTTFAQYSIPTVTVSASYTSIRDAIAELRALVQLSPSPGDFTLDIIVKDRFGAGGERIFKVTENYIEEIYSLLAAHKHARFVLQPFLTFTKGFTFRDITTATDIRLIYHNGVLIQTYIRRAKKHDFRCNSHQGATSTYITPEDVPIEIRDTARRIMRVLMYNHSLFTLDFAMSDTGSAYFLEGNISPGLYWDPGSRTEERMSKNLIDEIVHEIASRVLSQRTAAESRTSLPTVLPLSMRHSPYLPV